ncbi:MAG TPA: hypothetical protein H9881_08490 [Candidatus Stackebrandtia excrementipullorum]|nr:hypothetical protein [Candidatus Stackebrandtia excrementipullorum]
MTGITSRTAAIGIIVGVIAAAVVPTAAVAEEPEPGEQLCEIVDERLSELSGLVALPEGGYLGINDGSINQTAVDVFQLDESCGITGSYHSPIEPWDPEDLAMDDAGLLWVADIGDNQAERSTVAIHRIDTQTGVSAIYRFAYPDGAHDAEAMLLPPDGVPVFVTKGVGEATLYRATAPLDPNNPDGGRLENVGSITIEPTDTPGGPDQVNGIPLADVPSVMITGGAVSPEGDRAVLRTYTDAYEWEVEDGDVVAAITGDAEPVRTPLPGEPQGEAITYGPDGTFITGSESFTSADGQFSNAALWRYEPAVAASDAEEDATGDDAGPETGFVDFVIDTLGVNGILWVIALIGVVGLAMFSVGLRVILRTRANRRAAAEAKEAGSPVDGETADDPPGDRHDGYGYADDDPPAPRDDSHGPRARPDDGLSGGRLFEPVRRDDDDFRDWPYGRHNGEGRTGTVYGGRDDRDGDGTVYGGRRNR